MEKSNKIFMNIMDNFKEKARLVNKVNHLQQKIALQKVEIESKNAMIDALKSTLYEMKSETDGFFNIYNLQLDKMTKQIIKKSLN